MKHWLKELLVFLNKDVGAESPLKFCVDCKLQPKENHGNRD